MLLVGLLPSLLVSYLSYTTCPGLVLPTVVGLLTPINGGIFSVEVPSSQVLLACVMLTN